VARGKICNDYRKIDWILNSFLDPLTQDPDRNVLHKRVYRNNKVGAIFFQSSTDATATAVRQSTKVRHMNPTRIDAVVRDAPEQGVSY